MLLLALCAGCAGQRWSTAAAGGHHRPANLTIARPQWRDIAVGLVHKGQDIDRQGRDAVLGCHRALAGAELPVPGSGHWWNAK